MAKKVNQMKKNVKVDSKKMKKDTKLVNAKDSKNNNSLKKEKKTEKKGKNKLVKINNKEGLKKQKKEINNTSKIVKAGKDFNAKNKKKKNQYDDIDINTSINTDDESEFDVGQNDGDVTSGNSETYKQKEKRDAGDYVRVDHRDVVGELDRGASLPVHVVDTDCGDCAEQGGYCGCNQGDDQSVADGR